MEEGRDFIMEITISIADANGPRDLNLPEIASEKQIHLRANSPPPGSWGKVVDRDGIEPST